MNLWSPYPVGKNRKKSKFKFIAIIIVLIIAAVIITAVIKGKEKEKGDGIVDVVTSFYPVYVIANNLLDGIDGVTLTSLSEPKTGCLHDYQLTPDDMKLLSTADVFVINGSGAESFLDKVVKEYKKLTIIKGTDGIKAEEDILVHAWMNPEYYIKEIRNISNGLIKAIPEHKDDIAYNTQLYLDKVIGLDDYIKNMAYDGDSPVIKNKVVLLSEAFEPLAEYLGLKVLMVIDLDEEREVSSSEVREAIEAIMSNPGAFIMADETYGKKMADAIRSETNAKVYYIDPMTRGELEDMDFYIDRLTETFETLYK